METEGYVTLDGNGNVTASKLTVLVDGQANANQDTGSYTVNTDCGGTLTLNDSTQPLTFHIVAEIPDETTTIAPRFEGENTVTGLDLPIEAELLTDTTTSSASALTKTTQAASASGCTTQFSVGTLTGDTLKGGLGAEVDSAAFSLGLSKSAGAIPGAGYQTKVNGNTSPAMQLSGTYTLNTDCSFSGTVSGNGTTVTFNGQLSQFKRKSDGTTIPVRGTISIVDGTRGFSGAIFADTGGAFAGNY